MNFSKFANQVLAPMALSAALLSASPLVARAQAAAGAEFNVLHSFGESTMDNIYPVGPLVQGIDGDFYGVAIQNGPATENGPGTIFKISPSGQETTLYTTSSGEDEVYKGLVLGSDGNFYGVKGNYGQDKDGTLFRMTPAGKVSTIYSFKDSDGGPCETGLVIGPDGNFYGTTEGAGNSSTSYPATLFKVTADGQFTALYQLPLNVGTFAPPTFDSSGNLYDPVANGDGGNGIAVGDILKIDTSGAISVLYTFASDNYIAPNGGYPDAALTLAPDGTIYGLTQTGGFYGDGTAFMLTPSGTLSTLYSFPLNTAVSYRPEAGLDYGMILGSDGNLYGVTVFGGQNANGTVFQLSLNGEYTTLYTFSAQDSNGHNADGANPSCSLVEGSDGALYGVTVSGGLYGGTGTNGDGAFFKLTVPSLTASVPTPAPAARFDFNKDGHADLLWYNTASGSVSRWLADDQSVLQYGGTFSQVAPSSNWMPVAIPQTTGDGYPDLLWWNSSSGELSVWTLQDQSVTRYGADFAQITNTNWKPEAVADNSSNGAWTLVFEDAKSGDICRWLMNGTTVSQYGGTIASLGANTPWHIVGAPDLDGDGKSDLLFWNSQTGEVTYWSMDLANSKVLAEHAGIAQVTDTSWRLVASEDTNGDGHPDLVWWNAKTGEVSRWLMNGTTVTGYGAATTQVADTTWQPTAMR